MACPTWPPHGQRLDGRRQRARQRNVELPLIVSDHTDWDELTATIAELAPSEVWVTHGREEALVHWCMTRHIKPVRWR